MSASTSQYLSKFHLLLNNKQSHTEKETKLDSILYIWDDYRIQRLDENNYHCLWFNKIFQLINCTKSLDSVFILKVVIRTCANAI